MASTSMKGFTLLESIIVLALFVLAITIASQVYVNMMSSAIIAQSFQLGLDNFRFGAEKIWNEIKNGSDFRAGLEGIDFKDRHCRDITVYKSGYNLNFRINNRIMPLFDNELVKVNSFRIYTDQPQGGSADDPYYKSAYKLIVIEYQIEIKTKKMNIPLTIRQTIAPLNSVLIDKPCR